MAKKEIANIEIENTRIIFRNLAGKPDRFNLNGGVRKFAVVIEDPDFAEELKKEGWNIKKFNPREGEEGDPGSYLTVKVSYKNRPPHIYIVTKHGKTLLTEKTIDSLDYAEISSVDIVISPYVWNEEGDIAAYCRTMYVNVIEDNFASKYDFDSDEEIPFD